MLLGKVEAWAKGGSSATPHVQLLIYLLQSSLAAQRQLLEDASLADRCSHTKFYTVLLNLYCKYNQLLTRTAMCILAASWPA